MEKEIKITLSIKKAKEYYQSGNKELKEIALLAYDEEILNPITYPRIVDKLFKNGYIYVTSIGSDNIEETIGFTSSLDWGTGYFNTHDAEFLKYTAVLIKVKNMADYFNADNKLDEGYEIFTPKILTKQNYSNILFNKSEDATKAYSMLTKDERNYLHYLIV